MSIPTLKFPPRTPNSAERSIGALLMAAGRLDADRAGRIAEFQAETGLRFGEAGIALGLLNPADVRAALARQFDGLALSPSESSLAPEILAAFQPEHPLVERLRGVRSNLLLSWLKDGRPGQAVAVAGAEAGEGRSFVAANLSVLFAQLGRRTLLVDADLRTPRQDWLFGVAPGLGLSSILAERADLDAVRPAASIPGLSLLPSGPLPPNPQELLSRPRFAELVQQLRSRFDLILFDTPPSALAADGAIVAARAGAALLVNRPDAAPTATAAALLAALEQAGAELLGVVLNRH